MESEYAARFVWSPTVAAEAFHSRSSSSMKQRRAHQHSLDLSHNGLHSPPPHQQQQQRQQQGYNVLSIEANSSSSFVITSYLEQPKREALFDNNPVESRSSITNRIQQQVYYILCF